MPWTGGTATDGAWGMPGVVEATESLSHEELIAKIKELCRSNPVAKRQWCTWCDSFQGGTKDPMRIDVHSLRTFLTDFEMGSLGTGAVGAKPAPAVVVPAPKVALPVAAPVFHAKGGGGPPSRGAQEQPDLAEAIKVGQRTSTAFKNAWVAFCQMQGHKSFDPSRHTKEFLAAYFEFVGEQALATMPAPQLASHGAAGLPAPKRARTVPARVAAGAGALVSAGALVRASAEAAVAGDPAMVALVEKVKAVQRQDQSKWQLWADYCDSEHGGTKDPNRHTADSLTQFLASCEGS